MRTPADLPRRRRTGRGRVWLVVAAVALFVLLTSLRGLSSFYTTYLWFGELHLTSVWRGVLGIKVVLAALFTVIAFGLLFVSLTIAERLAPGVRAVGAEDEVVQRYRESVAPHSGKLRLLIAAVFALLVGTGTSSQWNNYLIFRSSVSFGTKDPQFHKDVGFYMFKLPFLSFLVDWAFVAIVLTLIVTVVFQYLNGGIRIQAPAQRVSPQVKAHISVLLFGLAVVKAVGYYLQRYELAFSGRGVVNGPTYTDVHAQLPAFQLLIFISLAAAVLFIVNIRRRGWVLPVIGVGLWAFISIIVGAIYPAFIQKFKVQPSELTRERPYIAKNITATRTALGLDKVETKEFNYNTNLTSTGLAEDSETIRNVRLWDPSLPDITTTYKKLQEIRSYYTFNDIDVDRYAIDGKPTQAIVAAREINPTDLPSQGFVNRRLQYTHGYGAILSPANAVTGDGKPDFLVKDVPPTGVPAITEPRVYYGEKTGGYTITHTSQPELDFQTVEGRTKSSEYTGKGGVAAGSALRRLAFALRFGDINPLISGQISSKSKVLYIRDISDRVRTAAPFLRYDADPYPVLISGRIQWVQDAYTVSSRYPNAQQADTDRLSAASGLNGSFNYVRNSVKVVIDAYDGTMKFYLIDKVDPVAKVYAKAFPKLFTDGDKIPDELRQHLRYPEDLFRVQTNMYGRYHITNAGDFYNAADGWNVAQDPGSGDPAAALSQTVTTNAQGLAIGPSRTKRMDPSYLLMRLPNESSLSFLILQPFVPVSQGDKQQNLSSFMTAKSDPGSYGHLQVFVMPRTGFVDGPAVVNSRVAGNSTISKEISLLNTQGSQVRLGNLLLIPIQQSLLYIRPLYVQSSQNPLPELRKVIVVFGDKAEMGDTLQEALTAVFGAAPPTLEQKGMAGQPTSHVTPGSAIPGAGGTTPGAVSPAVATLLAQAQSAFDAAQTALKAGDLAEYQRQINLVGQLLAQARGGAAAPAAPPPGAGGGGSAPATSTSASGSA